MNFIKQYKYHITIIIGLLLLILCLILVINRNNILNYQEDFTQSTTSNPDNTDGNKEKASSSTTTSNQDNTNSDNKENAPVLISDPIDAVNKNVRFKFTDILGNISYLCLLNTNTCTNYKSIKSPVCVTYSAGLQENKNEFTSFKLKDSPDSSMAGYTLVSNLSKIKLPYPTLTKTDYQTISFLCLGNSNDNNDIFFKIEKNNNDKFRLKFSENNKDYYVGICDSQYNCQQSDKSYTTLCLYNTMDKAIYFDIELDDTQDLAGKVCILYRYNK